MKDENAQNERKSINDVKQLKLFQFNCFQFNIKKRFENPFRKRREGGGKTKRLSYYSIHTRNILLCVQKRVLHTKYAYGNAALGG